MGKHWRGGGGSGGGGGGGGGGHDFASCRGHGVVIGTCDAARERETSKELVNLLNQAIEEVYPQSEKDDQAEEEEREREEEEKKRNNKEEEEGGGEKEEQSNTAQEHSSSSIENLLKAELQQVKKRRHGSTQNAVSIKTDVKGITLIKLTRRRFCPIKLVNAIFDRVKRENASCSRHVIRMIPLKHVFFPNEEELKATLQTVIEEGLGVTLPTSDEEPIAKRPKLDGELEEVATPAVAATPIRKVPYIVQFKARNHNVLTKDLTLSLATDMLRPFGFGEVHKPEVVIVVEALKNLCGISWLKSEEICGNYNIRKLQTEIAEKSAAASDLAKGSTTTLPPPEEKVEDA